MTDSDARLAMIARQYVAETLDADQDSKAGQTVPEDLEAIQYRVRTGLPAPPMQVWRY